MNGFLKKILEMYKQYLSDLDDACEIVRWPNLTSRTMFEASQHPLLIQATYVK
jgi:hypothetical protein